jgi:hypothetical protein
MYIVSNHTLDSLYISDTLYHEFYGGPTVVWVVLLVDLVRVEYKYGKDFPGGLHQQMIESSVVFVS